MDNSYLIPANTKRSTLIFGMLRITPDLWILLSGTAITIVALIATSTLGLLATILSLVPMLLCVLLVLPIPNYHNTLCAIQSVLNFYNNRRKFIWRGWCIYNEFKDNK